MIRSIYLQGTSTSASAEGALGSDISIILISEFYDPEVIITADWLSTRYELNISAFAVEVHKMLGESFLSFRQRYPLRELADLYESRRTLRKNVLRSDVTWDDILPNLEYPFANEGIALCLKHSQGDPKRRRFGRIRVNCDGFKWISLNFRKKYVNVYTKVVKEHGTGRIKDLFGDEVEINEWRDGISFLIRTKENFKKLSDWLEL